MCQRQNLQICLVTNQDELEAALANTRPLAVAWDLTNARPGDWNLVRRLRHHPARQPDAVYLYTVSSPKAPRLIAAAAPAWRWA